jgi:hypothetical protein
LFALRRKLIGRKSLNLESASSNILHSKDQAAVLGSYVKYKIHALNELHDILGLRVWVNLGDGSNPDEMHPSGISLRWSLCERHDLDGNGRVVLQGHCGGLCLLIRLGLDKHCRLSIADKLR